jgi:molybdate transport system regulatory protein
MKKEIRIRCWIDVDGEKFFGPGPAELLQLVEETGSIASAAKSMGMSYKKAWGIITNMNTKSLKPLVISHKGGKIAGELK